MYFKAAILALVAPLACATITLQQPSDVRSESKVTFVWTSTDPGTDPASFSIELLNTIFHDSYAVATNVPTALGTITITLPSVPQRDGYSFEAINISNITNVYSQTGQFSIGAPIASSGTAKGSGTSVVATTFPTMVTSSAFGSTVGASATSVAASGSSAVTSSGSKASSASGSSPSGFNGAMSHSTSYVGLALSAFAGVALLAL